jgi:hypothetical protein
LAITSKYHNTHLPSRTIFKYKHTGHTSEWKKGKIIYHFIP